LAITRKDAGESDPRNDETGALINEQDHNFAERYNDSKWIAKYLFLGNIFIRLNQLNISMQGKGKKNAAILAHTHGCQQETSDASKSKLK